MEKYNARFAKVPFEDRDVHRTLVIGHDDLDDAFAWKEERTVSVNLTLQYDQMLFILEPTGIARSLARRRVTVIDYPDGRLAIRYKGVDLPYRTFDKRPQVNPAAIVENKRLGPILATSPSSKSSSTCPVRPRRRGDVARRTTCSRSDRWTPGRRVARSGSFTRRPLEKQVINPNPQKGGYPAPNRVTFLTGPNRDFPKRR